MKAQLIESLDQLKELANVTNTARLECFIWLGIARSSKNISYWPETDTWDVDNEIDNTLQEQLTTEQLATETNIVRAINEGSFYQYIWNK